MSTAPPSGGDGAPVVAREAAAREEEADDEEDEEDEEEKVFRARMAEIRSNPSEERRYRYFRRSRIKPESVAKQIRPVFGSSDVPEEVALILATTAKMFVGDIVEEAREIMKERGISGPVSPVFVRLAYQRQGERGAVPYARAQQKPPL